LLIQYFLELQELFVYCTDNGNLHYNKQESSILEVRAYRRLRHITSTIRCHLESYHQVLSSCYLCKSLIEFLCFLEVNKYINQYTSHFWSLQILPLRHHESIYLCHDEHHFATDHDILRQIFVCILRYHVEDLNTTRLHSLIRLPTLSIQLHDDVLLNLFTLHSHHKDHYIRKCLIIRSADLTAFSLLQNSKWFRFK